MRFLFFVESSVETAFLEQTKESHDLQAFSSAMSGRGQRIYTTCMLQTPVTFWSGVQVL
jgi:hypothetical protein